MQIVDDQHKRHALRCIAEELRDRIKRAEAHTVIHRALGGALIGVRGQIRQDRGHVLHALAGHQLQLTLGAGAYVFAQHLHPGPVGRSARFLMAPPPQGERTAILGDLRKHFGAARLADAWLATEQQDLAPALHRRRQCCAESGEFAHPPDEGRIDLRCGLKGRHASPPETFWSAKKGVQLKMSGRGSIFAGRSATGGLQLPGCLSQLTFGLKSAKLPFGLGSQPQTCSS
jgi:hypothetical protein